jgi:hypothetical protein
VSFHLSSLLNELCSLHPLRVMESPAPHIGKSRNDMRTSERSNVRSPSWHNCSVKYDLCLTYLPKSWTYCLHRWMSSSINKTTLSMQSRHPQLRFIKIQKLGTLHVGSPSFHLSGVAASDKPKKLLNMPDQLAESVGSVLSCLLLSWPPLALRLESLSEIRSRWPYYLDIGDLW